VPILDGNLRGFETLPCGKPSTLDIFNCVAIGLGRLLFEISDKAVASLGGDKVSQKEAIGKDALGTKDHQLHEPSWLGHLEEGEKVHSFVVSIFQQGFDPVNVSKGPRSIMYAAHHPLSRFISLRLLKCLSIPPTIPGTPATVSRKMNRINHFLSDIIY